MGKEKEEVKSINKDLTTIPHKKGGNKPTMWDKVIKHNKDKIIQLIEGGASERQVATALGISWNCWMETKKKHPEEMDEMVDRPRTVLVGKLRSALISRAMGYAYEEQITEIRQDVDENNHPVGKKYVYQRTLKQFAPPDTTAIFACLKIYDKDNIQYDDKTQMIDIKRKELEIKQKESNPEEKEESLIEKIKGFKIEVVDASREKGEEYEKDS